MVCEIDLRAGVLVHRLRWPNPALSDECACRHVIDGPHRVADFALHRLPRLDRMRKRLHRRDRCGRKEPAYLRVTEHRDPRVGVPVFEGANDQTRRLEPDAHEADRKSPPRSVVEGALRVARRVRPKRCQPASVETRPPSAQREDRRLRPEPVDRREIRATVRREPVDPLRRR